MKMPTQPVKLAIFLTIINLACGTDKQDENVDGPAPQSVASSASTERSDAVPTRFDQLGLRNAIQVNPQVQVSAGFGLQEGGGKSREMCELEKMRYEDRGSLTGMEVTLCHLEVEADQIDFGTKYSLQERDEAGEIAYSYGIWIDDSSSGEITVNICENGSMQQKFTLTGLAVNQVRGTLKSVGVWEHGGIQQNVRLSAAFDNNYSDTDRRRLALKFRYENSEGDHHRTQSNYSESTAGVSSYEVARAGRFGVQTFADATYAVISPTYGQVMMHSNGGTFQDDNNQVSNYGPSTHYASFDSNGFIVEETASIDLQDGGRLRVEFADLPQFLPATFEPESFDENDWDCIGEEELVFAKSISGGARQQQHAQCDHLWEQLEVAEQELSDCNDSGYVLGPDLTDAGSLGEMSEEEANEKAEFVD